MKKLNKRGYLIVELVLASALAMTIAYFLLNLVVKLSAKNEDLYLETTLLTDKALMTNIIMEDINKYTLTSVDTTTEDKKKIITLKFSKKDSGEFEKYTIITLDSENNTFEYKTTDQDKNKLSNYFKKINSQIKSTKIEIKDTELTDKSTYDKNLNIKLTLKTLYSDNDYGININIPHKDGELKINNPSFADDSWATIVNNINVNPNAYSVGDTKCVALDRFTTTNNNGCSNGEFLVRIANTSTPSECSGKNFSQTACGFVVEFTDVISDYIMKSKSTNAGSWPSSEMKTYVDSTIYNALPNELKSVIINTKSVTGHGSSESTNFTSNNDKLYLLSPVEVYGANGDVTSYDSAYTSSRQLDYYLGQGVTINKNYNYAKKYDDTALTCWWLRTPDSRNNTKFWNVNSNGGSLTYEAQYSLGISPAFRIE